MLQFELPDGTILEVPETTLVDTHPVIQERRRSPESRKDHTHVVRAGGTYDSPPSHDWSTHGGPVSDPEWREKYWGKKGV